MVLNLFPPEVPGLLFRPAAWFSLGPWGMRSWGTGLLHHRQGCAWARVTWGQWLQGFQSGPAATPRGGLGELLPAGKGPAAQGRPLPLAWGFLCCWSGSHGGPGGLGEGFASCWCSGSGASSSTFPAPRPRGRARKVPPNRCPEGADAVAGPTDCTKHSIAWSPRPSIGGVSCTPHPRLR